MQDFQIIKQKNDKLQIQNRKLHSENSSQFLDIKLIKKELVLMKERIRNTIKYIKFYKSNNALKRR